MSKNIDAGGYGLAQHKHSIWALVLMVLADKMITLSFWHLEANPAVLALGKFGWMILSVGLSAGLVFLWYKFEGWKYRASTGAVLLVTALYATVVLVNSYVILSGL